MPDIFAQRAIHALEIMDDLELSGQEVARSLQSIARVNRLLGGHRLVGQALDQLVARSTIAPQSEWRIADLGCGGGDTLGFLSRWASARNLRAVFHGFDANPFIVDFARREMAGFSDIQFVQRDLLKAGVPKGYDILICSLFLHHFDEIQCHTLLNAMKASGARYILINDLHRHWLAYRLFAWYARLGRLPEMARHDGLISVRKGFTRTDLVDMLEPMTFTSYEISWRWAFRWQVLITNSLHA